MTSPLPIFNLEEFDVPSNRQTFAHALGDAYQQCGFVGITGHGIQQQVIDEAFAQSRAFFALPEASKKRYFLDNGGTRGYTPFGTEIAKGAEFVDLKEFWHVGRELPPALQANPPFAQLRPNIWPAEVPQFAKAMLALYSELERVGQQVLAALALYLGLASDYFVPKTQYGNSILRPLHYPPLPADSSCSVRAAAHEDINLITLLVGSKESGLEVLNKQGEWLAFNTVPNTLIVNIGDMLQRLSNYRLVSTTHRVVNPSGDAAKQSRYSIPFFMHPNPDMSLAALPSCVDAQHPVRDAPISADQFLQQRLREIGLIK